MNNKKPFAENKLVSFLFYLSSQCHSEGRNDKESFSFVSLLQPIICLISPTINIEKYKNETKIPAKFDNF